jgi:hypothetical protein
MANRKTHEKKAGPEDLATAVGMLPLWQLDIVELTGHNIEARGREEVNRLLQEGWLLLHIYTLKYEEGSLWRERPMAILGRPRDKQQEANKGGA